MAASETVRVSRETKQLLERLQALAVLETGRKPSLQEIVDAAVHLAAERREELLRRLTGWQPLGPGEAEELLESLLDDTPVEDVERDLESALYGGPR